MRTGVDWIRLAALCALLGAVAGCAVGANEFTCPEAPQGMPCTSTRDVYKATSGTEISPKAVNAPAGKEADSDTANSGDAASGEHSPASSPADAGKQKGAAPDGVGQGRRIHGTDVPVRQRQKLPVREPARVMRIWVAPWEAKSGALHMTGLIYTEIVERRWSIGVPAAEDNGVVRPLAKPGAKNPQRSRPKTRAQGDSAVNGGDRAGTPKQ